MQIVASNRSSLRGSDGGFHVNLRGQVVSYDKQYINRIDKPGSKNRDRVHDSMEETKKRPRESEDGNIKELSPYKRRNLCTSKQQSGCSLSDSEEDKSSAVTYPEDGPLDAKELRLSQTSSGYCSEESEEKDVIIAEKGPDASGDEVVSKTEDSTTSTVVRIRPDCDSEPVKFYAQGPGKRALCVRQEKDVLLMTDTGEDIPNCENAFVLADEQKINKRGINGTEAKLQTENRGTNIVVFIPDAGQPELKTASNEHSSNPSTILSKAVIHETVVQEKNCPRITIYYPSHPYWYYLVPSSNSTSNSITVERGEPSEDLVQKYMCWSHDPFEP